MLRINAEFLAEGYCYGLIALQTVLKIAIFPLVK